MTEGDLGISLPPTPCRLLEVVSVIAVIIVINDLS
jgi:hypothetical protein